MSLRPVIRDATYSIEGSHDMGDAIADDLHVDPRTVDAIEAALDDNDRVEDVWLTNHDLALRLVNALFGDEKP